MTPSEQKDAILRDLAGERRIRRLSLDAIAVEIGRDDHTVSRWERGLDNPGLGGLIAWATHLGFEVRLVKRGAAPAHNPALSAHQSDSREGRTPLNLGGQST